MDVAIQGVNCVVRYEIPEDGETITEIIGLIESVEIIKSINYYYRTKEQCPFNRGNLIVDIEILGGNLFCIKFPIEMSLEALEKYMMPLILKLLEYEKNEMVSH